MAKVRPGELEDHDAGLIAEITPPPRCVLFHAIDRDVEPDLGILSGKDRWAMGLEEIVEGIADGFDQLGRVIGSRSIIRERRWRGQEHATELHAVAVTRRTLLGPGSNGGAFVDQLERVDGRGACEWVFVSSFHALEIGQAVGRTVAPESLGRDASHDVILVAQGLSQRGEDFGIVARASIAEVAQASRGVRAHFEGWVTPDQSGESGDPRLLGFRAGARGQSFPADT